MADTPIGNVATDTATSSDYVVGVKDGTFRRFGASPSFAQLTGAPTATPTSSSTVLGETAGVVRRFLFAFGVKGDVGMPGYRAQTFAAPISAVLSCVFDIGGAGRATEILPRVNGAIPALVGTGAAAAGGGNFGNYTFNIGRNGTLLPFNGRLYSLILRGATPTAGQTADAVRYMAKLSGVNF